MGKPQHARIRAVTLKNLLANMQQAIIAQYESIFQAYELDQLILFLQGTYSC